MLPIQPKIRIQVLYPHMQNAECNKNVWYSTVLKNECVITHVLYDSKKKVQCICVHVHYKKTHCIVYVVHSIQKHVFCF